MSATSFKLGLLVGCLIAGAWIDGHTIDQPTHKIPEIVPTLNPADVHCFEDQALIVVVGQWDGATNDHQPDGPMVGAFGCVAVDDVYDPYGPDAWEMSPIEFEEMTR